MENWNLVVCGDLPDGPIGIFLPNPHKWTVADIRNEVEKKTGLHWREQTIYFNGSPIPEGEPLGKCEGMRNGAAVSLVANPLQLRVQRSDCDSIMILEIPRVELSPWDIQLLRKFILFKLGLDRNSTIVLTAEGEVLKDKKSVSDYKQIQDGCLITVTVVEVIKSYVLADFSSKFVQLPVGTTSKNKDLVEKQVCFGPITNVDPTDDYQLNKGIHQTLQSYTSSERRNWTIYIQQLDGTKTAFELEAHRNTAVFQLKEKISSKLHILPHQQKLTIGTIVLDDWDEDGKVLLLCNYPSIHDGVTVYLVCLTEGIRVNVARVNVAPHLYEEVSRKLEISTRNLLPFPGDQNISSPEYINIPNPKKFTIRHLGYIKSNFCEHYGRGIHIYNPGPWIGLKKRSPYDDSITIEVTDKPVSSEQLISDNVTIL